MKAKFANGFSAYVCEGDTITCTAGKYEITARIHRDNDADAPWEREDGHGPVTNWVRRGKNAGERVLSQDKGSFRYYDFTKAVALAKRDGWSYEGATGTKGEIAAKAAERDFEVLRAWCADEWSYCGIVLSVSRNGVALEEHAASLWGIELNYPGSKNEYLLEVAKELLPEALDAAKKTLAKLKA